MTGSIDINGARLLQRLEEFAAIGATKAGGVNRQALSVEDRQARSLLAELAVARGFRVYQDPVANLFIRRDGMRDDRPPFLIGSHLDSQPTGGRFDGALGTLAAFEVLESLQDRAIVTNGPVEVVAWTNEEGSRFTPGVMGSMAFSLGHVLDAWQNIQDAKGTRLQDAIADTLAALPEAEFRALGTPIAGYLELHIEQAPTLERDGIPVGIVTGVQGTRWLEIRVTGQAAHAGTTPLVYRRDPVVAVTTTLSALYASIMPNDLEARFTVGRMSVDPGSVNAIPGSLSLTIDLRHPDVQRLDAIEALIITLFQSACDTNGCTLETRRTFDVAPAIFDETIIRESENAARRLGLPFQHMISGAFHDALYISRVAPTAMIFVPCRDGLSHNEAEYVEPEHSISGARVLFETVRGLL
ncbi:N-carbamoyl-L-amino-acid hydrolase [Rhizobium sp. PP-WC-2G-219]|nr:N-carbamoyl-L-amino-acid hydrolase [Rhizobium sp. PP-F2F-G20b]TCL92238.1 N-carbamoyl-L-amino-acid hydrolase [Rhizobium sp. PP-WC-2G-219]